MRDFLVKIPFVPSIAEWVWGGHEDVNVSPSLCLEHVPLLSTPCLQQLVAKGLGVAIILGACLNKAPIIINIRNAKSSAGLSKSAMYGETLVSLNAAVYGFLEGYPFTAYGESIAIVIQSIIIILMMWEYSSFEGGGKAAAVSFTERVSVATISIVYLSVVINFLPKHWHYLLMASVWPVLLYARGSQIIETYQLKHTGAQSIVTTSMNLLGSLIRILTTLQEVGMDVAVISGYVLGIVTSGIMVVQYFLYHSNTEQVLNELKKKD